MSWYYYDDGRERKERLRREIQREGKLKPVTVPQGNRKLATTFWGKAWCNHLETHSDYEYRLPRGRSYLRQGNVYNLKIQAGSVSAAVAGSSLYDVRITIRPLAKDAWQRIKTECAGHVGSLLDLLSGRLGDGVLRAVTDRERGLFPNPGEMKPVCSCPDYADLCKHAAAVLYGVGAMLDTSPDLFFLLRSVDPAGLLADTAREALAETQRTDDALAGEDLSTLFGISLEGRVAPESETQKPAAKKPKKKRSAREPAAKEPSQTKTIVKKRIRGPATRRTKGKAVRRTRAKSNKQKS
jgi:uncharacterized Zn finger protein